MNTRLKNFLEYIRIIGVMARKDILDGVKNRNVLVLIFTAGLLVVFYKVLPSLSAGDEPPHVLVYDGGKSALTNLLEADPDLTVPPRFESEAAMISRLRDNDIPELGLVIPADFDRELESGVAPALQGFVMYWVEEGDALALRDKAAAEISRLTGKTVSVSIEGNTVFSTPEKDGAGGQASMAIVFVLVLIGVSLVPSILIDEKQSRTLDMLMVSPASETQIAVSKAIAGLFYTSAVAALALAVNYRVVMHWGLAAASVVLFGLLCVLLGLILGTWVETRAQFQLWSWALIMPMIMPLIIYLLGDLLPAFLVRIIPIFPAATMLILMRYVYAEPVTWGTPLLGLAWLMVWVVAEAGIVSWLLRRRDRADKPIAAANGLPGANHKRRESTAVPAAAAPAVISARREEMETPVNTGFRPGLRIIGAIAGKDVREAFRNRLFLSIMVGALLIAANGLILPILINWKHLPSAVIYDEGKSAAVRALAGREDCRVLLVRSRAEMEDEVERSFGDWVGIVVPPSFDQRTGEVDLEAEVTHWVNAGNAGRAIAFFESQLGSAGSPPVKILVAEKKLYPSADSSGLPLLNLFTQILVMVTMGFILVPLLLAEEKESRTMDMLMASPAGYLHFLAGKTLAGLAYCLVAGLMILLLNGYMVVHWEILLAAWVLSSAFVVAAGLLIGSLTGSPTAAAFWGGPLMILMVASALVKIFPGVILPAWLNAALAWSPAILILQLYRLAIAGEAPAAAVWGVAAALGGMTVVVYLAVIGIMRRKYSV
jgi:ABC-2 type transport system permease protein